MTTPASGLKARRAGGRPPVEAASPDGVSRPAASRASTRAPTVDLARPVIRISSARVRGVPSSISWSSSPAPEEALDAANEPTVLVTWVVKHIGLCRVMETQPDEIRHHFCLTDIQKYG